VNAMLVNIQLTPMTDKVVNRTGIFRQPFHLIMARSWRQQPGNLTLRITALVAQNILHPVKASHIISNVHYHSNSRPKRLNNELMSNINIWNSNFYEATLTSVRTGMIRFQHPLTTPSYLTNSGVLCQMQV